MKPVFNFGRWLEAECNGASKAYQDNFNKVCEPSYLRTILNLSNPSEFFMKFDWTETKEGSEYWGELHRRWMVFLNSRPVGDFIASRSYDINFTATTSTNGKTVSHIPKEELRSLKIFQITEKEFNEELI
jgi:hypothetical protein